MQTKFIHIKRMINPSKLFLLIWMITIFLYSFHFSKEVLPASFFSIILIIIYAILVYYSGYYRKIFNDKHRLKYNSLNKINIFIVFSICITLLLYEVLEEVSYFGSLPFLASFSFDDVNYNDATFIFKYKHNFFIKSNSIFLAGYSLFLFFVTNKQVKYLFVYILTIAVSFLYISRSTLISIGVISIIIYLSFNKIKFKHLFTFLLSLIFVFYLFDKLYFLRNRANINFFLNHYENFGIWKSVLRGAEEFYIYISSPLSNLLYNIDIETFKLFALHPFYLIRGFFPSKLAFAFFGDIYFNTSIIFPGNSNTYTTYPPLLFAFGIIGTLLLMIIIGISLRNIYQRTINNPGRWFLILVFVNHIIILSIFSTSLINPVYYFPIFLTYVFPPIKICKV